MKHSRLLVRAIVLAAIVPLGLASCTSVPTVIPEDLSAREIVQYAQTAYDDGRTRLSQRYYEALIERYGSDTAYYIEGQFEIAHIYIKKGKYDKAEPMLREILEIYDNSIPGQYPSSFKKLAELDYAKIPANKLPAE